MPAFRRPVKYVVSNKARMLEVPFEALMGAFFVGSHQVRKKPATSAERIAVRRWVEAMARLS
jgi:hypothetical protein